jgi:glycosyltransferase involved in cell wall biosynthesis
MPCFNSSKFISNSIISVIKQTYKNWELIIVDDASSDNSIEVIEKFQCSRIKVIKQSVNSGSGICRKVAYENSNGIYIAFLDSDDLWDKTKLSKQISFMNNNNFDFTYTSVLRKYNSGFIHKIVPPKRTNYKLFLGNSILVTSSVIIHKEKLKVKYFSPLRKGQDFITWANVLKNNYINAHLLDDFLTIYNVIPGSASSNKLLSALRQFRLYKNELKLNLYQSIYYFILYGINSVLKRIF